MAVTAGQMLFCFSGGVDNTTASASLGGTRSNQTMTDSVMNNLFDDVSAAEAESGDTEYRGIFIYLSCGAADSLTNARVWVSASTTAPGDEIAITTDSLGIQDPGAAAVMGTCTDESTTASTMDGTWSTYSQYHTVGTMTASTSLGIWIRRTVNASAASAASDQCTIAWDGETA